MGHIFTDQNRANNELNNDEEGLDGEDTDFTREEELRCPEEKETGDWKTREDHKCDELREGGLNIALIAVENARQFKWEPEDNRNKWEIVSANRVHPHFNNRSGKNNEEEKKAEEEVKVQEDLKREVRDNSYFKYFSAVVGIVVGILVDFVRLYLIVFLLLAFLHFLQ